MSRLGGNKRGREVSKLPPEKRPRSGSATPILHSQLSQTQHRAVTPIAAVATSPVSTVEVKPVALENRRSSTAASSVAEGYKIGGLLDTLVKQFLAEFDRIMKPPKNLKELGVPYKNRGAREASVETKQALQQRAKCWECGSPPQGAWTADHVPPKELAQSGRGWINYLNGKGLISCDLNLDKPYQLRPQCDSCRKKQAQLIGSISGRTGLAQKQANDANWDELSLDQQDLVVGGITSKGHIKGISAKENITRFDRTQIQAIAERFKSDGTKLGCHNCGAQVASVTFNADHFPPYSLENTPLLTQIYERILMARRGRNLREELNDAERWYLPHCTTCSSSQGGKMGTIHRIAREIKKIDRTLK